MNDQSLIDVANAFLVLSDYRFNIKVGKGQKILDFSVSASVGDATHICGLDHIPYISSLCGNRVKSKSSILKKIADGTLKYSSFPVSDQDSFTSDIPKTFNPLSQKPYTIEDRIKVLKDLMTLLENAYKGKFYNWKDSFVGIKTPDNKYRNISIKADYMLAIPTGTSNENLYVFMYCDRNNPNHLRIYSAFPDGVDLSQGQERPYTILAEEKVNTKTKQTTRLYTRPNFGSANIMKVTFNNDPGNTEQFSLNGNGAAALNAPRPTLRQALAALISGWADKIRESTERRRQESRLKIREVNELKGELEDLRSELGKKQEENVSLKNELQELRAENAQLIEQNKKPLVGAAARSTKSFAQGLEEFSRRPKEQSTQKLPEHNNSDHKHRK